MHWRERSVFGSSCDAPVDPAFYVAIGWQWQEDYARILRMNALSYLRSALEEERERARTAGRVSQEELEKIIREKERQEIQAPGQPGDENGR
jgi:hypothetical protein